ADLREVLGIVVDDLIGAEAAHVVTVRCARRGDYASTNLLGELNGEAGDAARPTLDEDRFSAVQLQRLLDGAQRGEARKCQSCGVDMRQPVGFLGEDDRLDRNLLGIGALLARCANAEDLIAYGQIRDTFSDRADHAGEVAAGNDRDPRLLVQAGTYLPVGGVHAGRHYVDHRLARTGNW